MDSIDVVIGRRVAELRQEKDWTQGQLRDLAARFGVEWSQSTVSEIESGKRKSDRLEILAVLCSMFGLTLEQLLDVDQDVMLSQPWSMKSLREGIRGELEPSPEVPGTKRWGGDNPVEVQRIAAKIDLTADELKAAVRAVYGTGARPVAQRDKIAGVEQADTSRTAQAKRGHATRKILAELQAAMDAEGKDALIARGKHDNIEVARKMGWEV